MIVLQPTSENIPDDIISYAYRIGQALKSSEQDEDRQARQELGNLYYFEAKKNSDIITVKIIVLSSGNFITRPRKLGINNGYTEGSVESGDGKIDYPMNDIVGNNATIEIDGDTVSLLRGKQEYGNIDWVGINTKDIGEPSNAPTLTWRGPSGRLTSFNPDVFVDGYTLPDIMFSEESAPIFTCFDNNIYENGSIAYTIPKLPYDVNEDNFTDTNPKVLGCAYSTSIFNGSEVTALVCVLNNHYENILGFFEEVWVNRGDNAIANPEAAKEEDKHLYGWMRMSSRKTNRPNYIWAFNQSGNKATQGAFEYTISLTDNTATLNVIDSDNGSYSIRHTESGSQLASSSRVDIQHEGEYILYSDYVGDVRVVSKLSVTDTVNKISKQDNIFSENSAPVHILGVRLPNTLSISGPTLAAVDAQYSLVGRYDSCCAMESLQWSFSGGTIDSSGKILTLTSCGMGTVSCSIIGSGCEDTSFERVVMLPDGVFCTVSDDIYNSNYYLYPSYTEVVDGVSVTEWGEARLQNYPSGSYDTAYWTPSIPCSCSTSCGYGLLSVVVSVVCNPFISGDTASQISTTVWPDLEPFTYNSVGGGVYTCDDHSAAITQMVTATSCKFIYRRLIEKWECAPC